MQNRGEKVNWRIKDLLIFHGRAQSPALVKGSTAGTARLSAEWVQIAKEIHAKYLPFGAIKQLHPKRWMKAKCISTANLITESTCLPLPTQQPGQQVCSLLPAVVSEVCFCLLFAHPFHGLTLSWGGRETIYVLDILIESFLKAVIMQRERRSETCIANLPCVSKGPRLSCDHLRCVSTHRSACGCFSAFYTHSFQFMEKGEQPTWSDFIRAEPIMVSRSENSEKQLGPDSKPLSYLLKGKEHKNHRTARLKISCSIDNGWGTERNPGEISLKDNEFWEVFFNVLQSVILFSEASFPSLTMRVSQLLHGMISFELKNRSKSSIMKLYTWPFRLINPNELNNIVASTEEFFCTSKNS